MTNNDDTRPSPEAMLKLAHAEEVTAELGKLKIFLGYAAGVGKTDSLLEGQEVIPLKEIHYMEVTLQEMDIDAILARKPQIVLVDELAHSNAPGSRHEKRW